MKKKLSSKVTNKKNTSFLFFALSTLAACNNDSKKILGLAGNAASEGLEKLFKESPSVNSNYTISTNSPDSSKGDGTSSLPIEVTGSVNASPTISGYPLLDFTFNSDGIIDFTNISDVKNISISNSSSAVSFTNLSNDLEKIFVSGTQSGDWNIAYKPNSFGTAFFEWTNNTGVSVDLTSLTINETSHFLLKNTGNENITIPIFNLDPDDTQRIEIGNDNDGDIIIGVAANIEGTQGLKTISLKTFNDGDIILGTPGTSGLPDLQNLTSIALIASKNGNITLGDLGTNTSINNISSLSMTTEGGEINIGTIKAKKIDNIIASGIEFSSISIGNTETNESLDFITLSGGGAISIGNIKAKNIDGLNASGGELSSITIGNTEVSETIDLITLSTEGTINLGNIKAKNIDGFNASGNEFSSISIGSIEISESIDLIKLSGDASITMGNFTGDGTVKLDASDMTKTGINLNFSALKGTVDITSTDKDDTISLGIEAGKVISGEGNDNIIVAANATGNSDITTGDGVDIITLSDQSGIDIVKPGGTSVNITNKTANTHAAILSDKIINFDPNSDKIAFGSVTASNDNFLSESGANTNSFSDALTKANTAMATGKIYYFSYNVANATDGFGLLFNDSNGDGSSDTFLTITGITTDVISYQDMIIA